MDIVTEMVLGPLRLKMCGKKRVTFAVPPGSTPSKTSVPNVSSWGGTLSPSLLSGSR
jgi:hypothetical protein